MVHKLEGHAASNFHLPWIGDESWMAYESYRETIWTAWRKEVDELERRTHYHRKTKVAAFSNGRGECFLNILPRSRPMDTKHFAEEIMDWKMSVIQKREIRTKGTFLFILTGRPYTTQERSWNTWSSRVQEDRPAYSPDLAQCDFFLFGYMREQLK
jgi:hypothetical protein